MLCYGSKVAEWLEAGTLAVWVVDPRQLTVTIHEPGTQAVVLGESEHLTGGRILPGFKSPVRQIFA